VLGSGLLRPGVLGSGLLLPGVLGSGLLLPGVLGSGLLLPGVLGSGSRNVSQSSVYNLQYSLRAGLNHPKLLTITS